MKKYAVAIALVAVILCLLVFIIQGQRRRVYETFDSAPFIIMDDKFPEGLERNGENAGIIPNRIWTFWDGTPLPFVERCIDTWRKHNPDYEITVLNKENYRDYMDDDVDSVPQSKDCIAKYSDYVRAAVLAKHGGFWLDSTMVLHEPLTWVHATQRKTGAEYVGFYIDKNSDKMPVIENWFFACVPNSAFMKDWYDEFYSSRNFPTTDAYVQHVLNTGTKYEFGDPNYLSMHVAAQKVIQQSPDKYRLCLFTVRNGPYRFLQDTDWDSKRGVDLLLGENTYSKYANSPLIKITGRERKEILSRPAADIDRLFLDSSP